MTDGLVFGSPDRGRLEDVAEERADFAVELLDQSVDEGLIGHSKLLLGFSVGRMHTPLPAANV